MSNSFYTYKEVYKKKFNGKYSDYNLITDLRNYAVHNNLAITKIEIDIINKKKYIYISPKEIIKDERNISSKTKKILKSLIKKNKNIDLKYLTGSFLVFLMNYNQIL